MLREGTVSQTTQLLAARDVAQVPPQAVKPVFSV
jgi:hypothetical protein